jgi:hypothetical protein
LVPIPPDLYHVLDHVDLVSAQLLQEVFVELSLFSLEAVDLHEGHQSDDDVGEALHSLFLLLVVFVLDFQLILLFGVALLVENQLVDRLVVFAYFEVQLVLFIFVGLDSRNGL